MFRLERVFLYFFIIFLFIGWITNPLMDNLINLNIGIFGFLGVGTFLLLFYIYRRSEHRSFLNFIIEFFISCLLIIVMILFFL